MLAMEVNAPEDDRPKTMIAVRYVLPAVILLAGIVALLVSDTLTGLEGLAMGIGVAASVLLLNVLYRVALGLIAVGIGLDLVGRRRRAAVGILLGVVLLLGVGTHGMLPRWWRWRRASRAAAHPTLRLAAGDFLARHVVGPCVGLLLAEAALVRRARPVRALVGGLRGLLDRRVLARTFLLAFLIRHLPLLRSGTQADYPTLPGEHSTDLARSACPRYGVGTGSLAPTSTSCDAACTLRTTFDSART